MRRRSLAGPAAVFDSLTVSTSTYLHDEPQKDVSPSSDGTASLDGPKGAQATPGDAPLSHDYPDAPHNADHVCIHNKQAVQRVEDGWTSPPYQPVVSDQVTWRASSAPNMGEVRRVFGPAAAPGGHGRSTPVEKSSGSVGSADASVGYDDFPNFGPTRQSPAAVVPGGHRPMSLSAPEISAPDIIPLASQDPPQAAVAAAEFLSANYAGRSSTLPNALDVEELLADMDFSDQGDEHAYSISPARQIYSGTGLRASLTARARCCRTPPPLRQSNKVQRRLAKAEALRQQAAPVHLRRSKFSGSRLCLEVSEDAMERVRRRCVVCGAVNTTGKERKSGWKCNGCVGTRHNAENREDFAYRRMPSYLPKNAALPPADAEEQRFRDWVRDERERRGRRRGRRGSTDLPLRAATCPDASPTAAPDVEFDLRLRAPPPPEPPRADTPRGLPHLLRVPQQWRWLVTDPTAALAAATAVLVAWLFGTSLLAALGAGAASS